MKKLIIIGASGHGKVLADIAYKNEYEIIEFLDDDLSKRTNGKYKVVGTTNDIDKYINQYDFIVGIGDNVIRKKYCEILSSQNIELAILIHPSAIIDPTVVIGSGTVIMANAVINANTTIGKCNIINTASTLDHDCFIGDFVHISPGVHIAGNVHIGNNNWIGVGSSIINNLNICSDVIVGAGTTLIHDIKEPGTYVGIPLRRLNK